MSNSIEWGFALHHMSGVQLSPRKPYLAVLLWVVLVPTFLWCGAAFPCWVVLPSRRFCWEFLLSPCSFFGVVVLCPLPPPFGGAALLSLLSVVLLSPSLLLLL